MTITLNELVRRVNDAVSEKHDHYRVWIQVPDESGDGFVYRGVDGVHVSPALGGLVIEVDSTVRRL